MDMESACLSVNTGRLCVRKGYEHINVGMYPCSVYMACFNISLGYQALGLGEDLMHTIPSLPLGDSGGRDMVGIGVRAVGTQRPGSSL